MQQLFRTLSTGGFLTLCFFLGSALPVYAVPNFGGNIGAGEAFLALLTLLLFILALLSIPALLALTMRWLILQSEPFYYVGYSLTIVLSCIAWFSTLIITCSLLIDKWPTNFEESFLVMILSILAVVLASLCAFYIARIPRKEVKKLD